jgi:hypothetical protein
MLYYGSKLRLQLCREPWYSSKKQESMAGAAAIGVVMLLQKPLKPLYCGCNSGCKLQFRTMFCNLIYSAYSHCMVVWEKNIFVSQDALPSRRKKAHKMAIVFGLSLGCLCLLVLGFGLVLWRRHKHHRQAFFDVKGTLLFVMYLMIRNKIRSMIQKIGFAIHDLNLDLITMLQTDITKKST